MTMPTPQEARRLFSQILRMPDQEISLVEATLLIAARQGSDAHMELCMAQLAAMAHRAQTLLQIEGVHEPALDPRRTVAVINKVLFEEEGFTGNRDDYYDVDNSYLDRVLARRTGIPITLSIVYIEVAKLVGLRMHGIGLPGHFVVGYYPAGRGRTPSLIIDPFNEGQILSPDDCAARVHAAYGDDVRFTPEWLQPMTNRQVLARVLGNLKQIYISAEQFHEALRAIDLLLIVQPDAIWELKERGMLYYRTGVFVLALADLRRYLKLAPEGEDSYLTKYYVDLLRRLVVSSN
jgi:regulator of sirC expression with transglutaminase-like and TPR domain